MFCDCQRTKTFNYYKQKFKIKCIQKKTKQNAYKKMCHYLFELGMRSNQFQIIQSIKLFEWFESLKA
jgi:hypothetical protein